MQENSKNYKLEIENLAINALESTGARTKLYVAKFTLLTDAYMSKIDLTELGRQTVLQYAEELGYGNFSR